MKVADLSGEEDIVIGMDLSARQVEWKPEYMLGDHARVDLIVIVDHGARIPDHDRRSWNARISLQSNISLVL